MDGEHKRKYINKIGYGEKAIKEYYDVSKRKQEKIPIIIQTAFQWK